MPGRMYCRYSPVEPAPAPPNRYVNISRNSTGVIVTSIICSGTCLILSMPRQPNVIAADTRPGCGGRAPDASAACRRSSLVRGSVFVIGLLLRGMAREREEHLIE